MSHPPFQPATGIHRDQTPLAFIHGSYFPSWRVYRGARPSALNLACTTHLYYAFARVHANGELHLLDEKADLQLPIDNATGCIEACVRLKIQHPSLKVLLSVGGGSGSQEFAQLASRKDSRARFASSARDFCDRHGFDGIDLDWEHPNNPEQGSDYVKLLRALRQSLPNHILTTALPAGEWCLRNIDVKEASHILNFINVMCYDFAGPWTETSGHQAQLYAPKTPHNAFAKRSGHSAISYFLSKDVDSRKLVLGIPAYGRSFLGVDDIGQKFTGHAGESGGTLEYKILPQLDAQEIIDRNVVAAYCVGGDAGFVSYDTPETVAIKAEYVKQMNLAGLFYWTGVSDVEFGPRSLIQAGFDALMK